MSEFKIPPEALKELQDVIVQSALERMLIEVGLKNPPEEEPLLQFIYVMYRVDDPNGCLKIGMSFNPVVRAQHLSIGTTTAIRVAWTTEKCYERARIIEREAHRLLKSKRVRGEWFRCSLEEAIDAVNEAIKVWQRRKFLPVQAGLK